MSITDVFQMVSEDNVAPSGAAQRTVTWDYDLADNIVDVADSAGATGPLAVNALDQVTSVGGYATSISYLESGEEQARLTATGDWDWVRDAEGRPLSVTVTNTGGRRPPSTLPPH